MKPDQQDKQLLGIAKSVLPYSIGLCVIMVFIALIFKDIKAVYSILMGAFFSFIMLRQMERDQYLVLIKKQKKFVFFGFIGRLLLLSIPIIFAIKYKSYFKFWIVLVFLFSSQLIFIINELIINYKKYKRRVKEDG